MSRSEVIHVDPQQPDAAAIRRAAELLRQGRLVAFPTETVYGLGADALNPDAVRGIFAAKGRPAGNPLIVHLARELAARELAAEWPVVAQQLAQQFWPGSLTLVVRKCPAIPDIVTAGGPTVALRVPAHPVAQALLAAAGLPVAAPSANRSNRLSPTRAEHVRADLDGRVDLILDGGPAWGGLESTVLDLTVMPPRLLRPGLITAAQIEAVIGPIVRPDQARRAPADEGPLRSPGLLGKHYAPHTPLECVTGDGTPRVRELAAQGLRVGWLPFGDRSVPEVTGVVMYPMPEDARAYAALLYDVLHRLDQVGLDRMVVEWPPPGDEWAASRDRLARAAG
jgi:L-threonylcarbamoyladenylate synthase